MIFIKYTKYTNGEIKIFYCFSASNDNSFDEKLEIPTECRLLDLLDKAPHIIEKIFGYLKLTDRLNIGMTCKEMEQIHNNQSKFWEHVWLDVGKGTGHIELNLTRKYCNFRYVFGAKSSEPSLSRLASSASNVKKLEIIYRLTKTDIELQNARPRHQQHARLIETINSLRLFDNLMSLDLQLDFGSDYDVEFDIRKSKFYLFNEPIKMSKLQNLKIEAYMLIHLYRLFDFSCTDQLKSIDIFYTEGAYSFEDSTQNNEDQHRACLAMLKELIGRQKYLKSLKLTFSGCMRVFDHSFTMQSQLEKFEMIDELDDGMGIEKQDNMIGFLGPSQETLRECKMDTMDLSSPRMKSFLASVLTMPLKTQTITFVHKDHDMYRFISSDPLYFTMKEFHHLLRPPVKQNFATVQFKLILDVAIKFHCNHEWMLTGICEKYPNLNTFSIKEDSYGLGTTPNLLPLRNLLHLSTLEMDVYRLCSSLREVVIPTLKSFQIAFNTVPGERGSMQHQDLNKVRMFLNRHKALTHFKLQISNQIKHEASSLATALFDLLHFTIENLEELNVIELIGVSLREINAALFDTLQLLMKKHANSKLTVKLRDLEQNIEMVYEKTADSVKISCLKCE